MNIRISPKVLEKIFVYSALCDTEVMGFGSYNTRTRVIDTLFPLFDQTAGTADAEVDEDVMAQIAESDISGKVNFWWHSHVNMGVFWSATDEAGIRSLGLGCPWIVSLVVNKSREYRCRVDWFHPVQAKIDEINLVTAYSLEKELKDRMKDEIENKVSTRRSKVTVYPYSGGRGHSQSAELFGSEGTRMPDWMKSLEIKEKNGLLIPGRQLPPHNGSDTTNEKGRSTIGSDNDAAD